MSKLQNDTNLLASSKLADAGVLQRSHDRAAGGNETARDHRYRWYIQQFGHVKEQFGFVSPCGHPTYLWMRPRYV